MKTTNSIVFKIKTVSATLFIVCLLFCTLSAKAIQMNYQGVVKQSSVAYQGTGYFKFAMGDSGGTTNYWANDGTSEGEPGTNVQVNVTNGFFHLALGNNMTNIPVEVFTDNADVYLRVWFAEFLAGPYSTLGGAQQIRPVPMAINAEMLEGYSYVTLTNSININDADADPANEFNSSVVLSNAILKVTDAGGTLSANLSNLIDDADADPSNEFNSAVILNGTTLEVVDKGGTNSADLASLVDDGDWDTSGNNIYNANTGNVGIGVTNPIEKLEVVGNILARNNANTSTLKFSPSQVGTNLSITGCDNDGTANYPIHISDEDGYDILKVRASLSPGARFGNNASKSSFNGIVEANVFTGGKAHHIDEGADYCFIGGGLTNRIENSYSDYSGIASGKDNIIGVNYSSPYSFIGGGRTNIVDNDYSVIAGGRLNYIKRLYSFIGGGMNNRVIDDRSVICGGADNLANEYSEYSFIGGGYRNLIRSYNPSDKYNTLVSGFINSISNSYDAFLGGGSWNNISYGPFSVIAGGQRNISFEKGTTISGGRANRIVGEYCTVGGGWSNKVDGYSYYSTIPGGLENRIYASNYGFAAGRYAKIWHNGCFVWADSNLSDVNTSAENQFIARASGGFVFMTAVNGTTTGAQLPAGSGSWSSLSDKNSKENFKEINGREVLDKICAMTISTWNYKTQDGSIRHAGPMAQDFYAAFGLGEDERRLSNVDVDGIALAAIKELKKQKDAEIAALHWEKNTEINELKKKVEALMQRIDALKNK